MPPGPISVPLAENEGRHGGDVPKPVEAPNGWGRFGVARVDADHYREPLHQPHALQPAHHAPGHDGFGFHGLSHVGDLGDVAGFDLGHFGAFAPGTPVLVVPIEHLEINNNTFIQNTLNENNTIIFNAANGGDVDIGGSVNALGLGTSHIAVDSFHQSGSAADLGWGPNAFGEAGGFDAVLVGHLPAEALPPGSGPSPLVIVPIEHLEVNNNTFIQNTQNETNTLLFNAGDGGSIDVAGNVTALASQQALIEHHA